MRLRSFGFTLLEILVALTVVSVGVTVIVSGYTSALALAQSSRNQAVAVALAEERMQALSQDPAAYDWGLQNAAPNQRVHVNLRGKPSDSYPVEPPATLPVDRAANSREEVLYGRFSWKAFASLPSADATRVEVTVAIQWTESGRERVYALTSMIARSAIAAAQAAVRAEGST